LPLEDLPELNHLLITDPRLQREAGHYMVIEVLLRRMARRGLFRRPPAAAGPGRLKDRTERGTTNDTNHTNFRSTTE
jgi:hypothetical protein